LDVRSARKSISTTNTAMIVACQSRRETNAGSVGGGVANKVGALIEIRTVSWCVIAVVGLASN